MGRQKEPVDLLIAKGASHLTKSEIEERRSSEVKVCYTDVKRPDFVPSRLNSKFDRLAYMLVDIGIMTELDEDALGRYVTAQSLYEEYTAALNKALKTADLNEITAAQKLQDIAFKQADKAAAALGLTITSRCRIVAPKGYEDDKPKNKFASFEVK